MVETDNQQKALTDREKLLIEFFNSGELATFWLSLKAEYREVHDMTMDNVKAVFSPNREFLAGYAKAMEDAMNIDAQYTGKKVIVKDGIYYKAE